MFTTDVGVATTSSFLVISNLFATLNITKLLIPEVVQKGNSSAVTLDCDFLAVDGDFTLRWLFNKELVYEWTPSKEPIVRGALDGRLDLNDLFLDPLKQHRALRILAPDEGLSGEYTCVVTNTQSEARRSGHMLVFSPQSELSLDWHTVWNSEHQRHQIQVICLARGLYPQPELVIERKKPLYDARTEADYQAHQLRDAETFSCRLAIPAAGYVAMFDKLIAFRNTTTPSNSSTQSYNNFVPHSIHVAILVCLLYYINIHFGR